MTSLIRRTIPKSQSGNVGIIGAGISGLTFAYFLSKLRPDLNIKILENSNRVGGYINTKKIEIENLDSRSNSNTTVFEKGPRTLRGVSDGTLILIDLLHQFKNQHELLGIYKDSDANKKYLLSPHLDTDGRSGKLTQTPNSLLTFWKFLFDPLGRSIIFATLKEPFVRSKLASNDDETVEQFITRRFNKNISDNIVSALMHGVYAGDVGQLSIKAIMPKLVEIEKSHGSIILYFVKQAFNSLKNIKKNEGEALKLNDTLQKYTDLFKPSFSFLKTSAFLKNFPVLSLNEGLENLPMLIAKNMPSNVEIIKNCNITSIEPTDEGVKVDTESNGSFQFDHLRSTINLHKLANIIPNDTQLSERLKEMKYANVVLANVFIPHLKELPLSGFGFLVPKSMIDETQLLGVIFDSDVEQNARRLFFYNDVQNALAASKSSKINKQKLDEVAKLVSKRGNVITNSYTKVTLMIGGYQIKSLDELPSRSRVRKTIRDVLYSKLYIDLDKYKGEHIYEVDYIVESIPQYGVGYLDLKQDCWTLANEQFDGRFSFGGMALGDGVGVPDCIMNSFKDAVSLGEIK